MKSIFLKTIYLFSILISVILASCADDFPFSNSEIPDGEGNLSATVTFTPTTARDLGETRTSGDAIQDIKSLCVLVYSTKGDLIKKFNQKELEGYTLGNYTVNKDKDHLDGSDAHTDETTTAQATFSLKGLPFGQYKMYAVANMGNLDQYEDEITTEEGLKNIRLTWNENTIENNNQMFGYFTTDRNMESKGFDAPAIFFKDREMKIHAWLKRAASKVTVAFDASGLNQGVRIYIRNVTIRDIPKSCLLGAENTPESTEALYNHLAKYDVPDYNQQTEAIPNSRLEYDSNGVITDGKHTGNAKTDGLRLDNSLRNTVPTNAHATDAPSLFFYENNQNIWLEQKDPNYKNDSDSLYYKGPRKNEVGTPIRDPEDDKDFKDRVPYGTYIEVEAYYISDNPARLGEGTIKYRFMLGKDTSWDYNAQRNYHFKVTLGFKGWANDPDWHIDYELPSPGLEVPPTFRVSYLYGQMSELPIRILGDIQWLTVEIKENNWAPYDPTSSNQVPASTIPSNPATYEFKWNYDAFTNKEYMSNNVPRPEFGFLALHLPDRRTTIIEKNFSKEANNELIQHYNTYQEGIRRFNKENLDFGTRISTFFDTQIATEDDKYTVKEVLNDLGNPLPNQRTLMLPLWTRAKTLISGSGFSGNNPYEAFERRAKLLVKAQFSDGTTIEKEVEVLQVKRIVNPKGVWRAHDRTEAFNVTLLEAINSNAESDFQPFTSEGEWTAFIDQQTNAGGFSIRPNGDTNGFIRNDTIHGNTGSTINFAINFGSKVGADQSECAVVKVLYHGNQCMHKIFIRKGYNAPLRMGSAGGGKLWSSFSLYQATKRGGTEGVNETFDAVLTKNPLMLGSMFRRGKLDQGIFVWNNQQRGLGPFEAPGSKTFVIGKRSTGTGNWENQWEKKTWDNISCWPDTTSKHNFGTFYAKDDNGNTHIYRVPKYSDFQDLTENSEFGFGVFYGSAATAPKLKAEEAYGLIDPENEGLFNSEMGMRAVVAYDKKTGNQIVFPMGRYGIGVRRMYNIQNTTYRGVLRYADVYNPLTLQANNNNLYRPIPYNLPIVSGNIYWIDQYYPSKDGCLGWDMNYFNFDFNEYTANNFRDACPIKFILVE